MRVQRAHVQAIAENPKSAIHRAATYGGDKIGRQPAAISPDRTARPAVNRPGLIVVSGDVQNAVDDERRVLNAAPGQAGDIGLENPLRDKPRHVLRRQLFQRAVPLPGVIARKRQPARRILQTSEQVLIRDRSRRRFLLPGKCKPAERKRQCRNENHPPHHRGFFHDAFRNGDEEISLVNLQLAHRTLLRPPAQPNCRRS